MFTLPKIPADVHMSDARSMKFCPACGLAKPGNPGDGMVCGNCFKVQCGETPGFKYFQRTFEEWLSDYRNELILHGRNLVNGARVCVARAENLAVRGMYGTITQSNRKDRLLRVRLDNGAIYYPTPQNVDAISFVASPLDIMILGKDSAERFSAIAPR